MQKLNTKDISAIYGRCLNLVKRKPPEFFIFKKMKFCQGTCDWEGEVLEFDYRKELARTAFHECIHYLYPEWSETMVLYAESRVINKCTSFDVARFLKCFTAKLYKAELNRTLTEKKKKKGKSKPGKKLQK
jgi:hypothetical protein